MDPILDTAGWENALDRMESDLAAALTLPAQDFPAREDAGFHEQAAAHEDGALHEGAARAGWQPPSGLGPIPAELRERARRLALAQQEAIHELQTTATSHRKHAAFIDTIPTAGRSSRAVYLDTTG